MMSPGDLIIYRDILGREHEVEFIQASQEGYTRQVILGDRKIWILPAQIVRETGRKADHSAAAAPKKKTWTIGDAVPEHAKKKKKKAAAKKK
jgi:hypothetical protein